MIGAVAKHLLNALGIQGKANRDRAIRLFVAVGAAFGAVVALAAVAQLAGVDMARAAALTAVVAAVVIVAYRHPVQGILRQMRTSVLTRPATRDTYIDQTAATLLTLATAVTLRAAAVAADRLAGMRAATFHVVHVAVLPARFSTALVAAQRQLGAGVQPA